MLCRCPIWAETFGRASFTIATLGILFTAPGCSPSTKPNATSESDNESSQRPASAEPAGRGGVESDPITISRDGDYLVFKYNVREAVELKPGEWPALFVFLSRADGPVLNERIIKAKDARAKSGVDGESSITPQANVYFWQIAAEESPGLAGYRLGIYDTDAKKIRTGAELTIPFSGLDNMRDLDGFTPSLNWDRLGPEVTISAALLAFKTEKNDFVFQRFLSQVGSKRVKRKG